MNLLGIWNRLFNSPIPTVTKAPSVTEASPKSLESTNLFYRLEINEFDYPDSPTVGNSVFDCVHETFDSFGKIWKIMPIRCS